VDIKVSDGFLQISKKIRFFHQKLCVLILKCLQSWKERQKGRYLTWGHGKHVGGVVSAFCCKQSCCDSLLGWISLLSFHFHFVNPKKYLWNALLSNCKDKNSVSLDTHYLASSYRTPRTFKVFLKGTLYPWMSLLFPNLRPTH